MADAKISALPASTTPLAGTEVLPIVQSGVTKKVSVANLTEGRGISAASLGVGTTTPDALIDVFSASQGYAGVGLRGFSGGIKWYVNAGISGVSANIFSIGNNANGTSPYLAVSPVGGVSIGNTTDPGASNLSVSGSVIISTAGKGIDFSADGQATGMTSELLDDYEEGTWTPVYVAQTGTLGSITYENVQGQYVKIGRQVTVTGGIYCSAFDAGTGSGDLRIGGLPFTNSGVFSTTAIAESRLFTTNNPTSGFVNISATTATWFYRTTANGGINNLQVSDAATGAGALNLIYFTATYQV